MKPNITGLKRIRQRFAVDQESEQEEARAAARIVKGPWRDFALNVARPSEQKMAVWVNVVKQGGDEFILGFESVEAYVSDSPDIPPAVSVPLENAVVYRFYRPLAQVSMDAPFAAEQLLALVDKKAAFIGGVVVMGQLCDGVRTESILEPQAGRAVIGVRPNPKAVEKEFERFTRALANHGWLESFPKVAEGRLEIQGPPAGGWWTVSRLVNL